MTAVLAALAEQQSELVGLVADLDESGWNLPSRCPGWTVGDVLLHLAQTDELAAASARGRLAEAAAALAEQVGNGEIADVDAWADAFVAAQRGAPGAAVFERYVHGARDMVDAFSECGPSARLVWVAGELAARTLAATRLSETWIHTGDVAAAFGVRLAPTDRLYHVARLAWRTVPYAFMREGRELTGPVAFELTGPGGGPWHFDPTEPAVTVVRGDAAELCEVAGRRIPASDTALEAVGPDADVVLSLVRTFA